MNEYVAKITLDLNCQATPIVISAGQYDIGRRIKINLTADGEAYDATGATAVCKGKSGSNYFAVNATVAKNIVTVTTDKAMLSSAGRTVAKIVLTDGTRTYSTQPFVINTHSDYDGDITTSDYYPELLDILSRVIALTESGAVLTDTTLDAKSVNPVQNKVLTAIINNKANKATTLAGYGITDAYTREKTNEKLAQKLNSMPFDSEPKNNSPCYLTSGTVYNSLLTKADKTETDNSLGEKADKADVDTSLANKANLINSLNIFDFDAWAKGLQKMNPPVFHGTLDELNFDEKSITITTTEYDGYTNSWKSSSQSSVEAMKISVKPNTKYWISWFTNNYTSNGMVFLNANTETKVIIKNGKGTFITSNDTSFITLRFGSYPTTTFKVSEIMITEKESIYLPNKVAEGVPEVANEVLKFEKTTQTSLDGKYDSANIESGTSTLTPYSTVTDKIKSASCTYKTIGDIVIVSATVKMNAATIGANSTYPLIDLPYKCIAEDNVFCVGISNLGKVFKFAVLKNNTWLQFQTQDKTAYTFADGEQINVICSYKIK
nr:BppU family phage baseplate upper protein [Ruminococcus bromii]